MQYTVLSRKWRPKNFDQVVGQKHVTTILINSIKGNRVSHAYLFSGPRGTGKTTIARILAQNLNNVENINDSLDIIELDGASNRGIDEIRDLKDSIRYAPSEGKYKIYIIDEAHMLTKEAFNALLKTLEEPPSHVVFVLATTESHKIPPTISSRCQKYDFKKISVQKIFNHLQSILKAEKYTSEDKALSLISVKSDGSLRDALSLLDKIMAISDNSITYETTKDILGIVDEEQYLGILQCIEEEEIDRTIKAINEVIDSGISISNFLDGFNSFLRDVVCYKINYNEKLNLTNHSKQYLDSSNMEKSYIMKILSINIDYINDSRKSIDRLSLENLFLKYFTVKDEEKGESKDTQSHNKSVEASKLKQPMKPEASSIKEVEKKEPLEVKSSMPHELEKENLINTDLKDKESLPQNRIRLHTLGNFLKNVPYFFKMRKNN